MLEIVVIIAQGLLLASEMMPMQAIERPVVLTEKTVTPDVSRILDDWEKATSRQVERRLFGMETQRDKFWNSLCISGVSLKLKRPDGWRWRKEPLPHSSASPKDRGNPIEWRSRLERGHLAVTMICRVKQGTVTYHHDVLFARDFEPNSMGKFFLEDSFAIPELLRTLYFRFDAQKMIEDYHINRIEPVRSLQKPLTYRLAFTRRADASKSGFAACLPRFEVELIRETNLPGNVFVGEVEGRYRQYQFGLSELDFEYRKATHVIPERSPMKGTAR